MLRWNHRQTAQYRQLILGADATRAVIGAKKVVTEVIIEIGVLGFSVTSRQAAELDERLVDAQGRAVHTTISPGLVVRMTINGVDTQKRTQQTVIRIRAGIELDFRAALERRLVDLTARAVERTVTFIGRVVGIVGAHIPLDAQAGIGTGI